MKSEAGRDEQTVTIAATLALFIAVMSIGVAALWLASVTTTPSSRAQNLILQAALIPAVVISGRYLLKHRRP
ncbi:MAG: hypothetical protein ABIR39_20690 [Nocardioides sp.]|uniref:hypothetical protein n=1 Tax=Nocardioides sp. TaxID=35761 RepID=UPI0032679940